MSNCLKTIHNNSSRINYEKNIFDVSYRTRQSYSTALNNFEDFCYNETQEKDVIKKLKKIDDYELWAFLQNWVDSNSNLDPSSVKIFFSHIKKYLYFCGIKITNQEINENLKFMTVHKKQPYLLARTEIARILNELTYRDKTLFLCQISSGMRIGELVQLTKSNLKYTNHRMIVTINNLKNNEKMTVFSKEATDMIKPLLRIKDENDFIFGTNKNPHYSEINKEQVLRRALKRSDLDMTHTNSTRHKINTSSFRFFHFVTVSEFDYNFACQMRGCENKINFIKFEQMPSDKLLDKYLEIEKELTIYN